MAQGPGKYDELATLVRKTARAKLAAVLILNGDKGQGLSMSVQLENAEGDAEFLAKVPALLRAAAANLDRDLEAARSTIPAPR